MTVERRSCELSRGGGGGGDGRGGSSSEAEEEEAAASNHGVGAEHEITKYHYVPRVPGYLHLCLPTFYILTIDP